MAGSARAAAVASSSLARWTRAADTAELLLVVDGWLGLREVAFAPIVAAAVVVDDARAAPAAAVQVGERTCCWFLASC